MGTLFDSPNEISPDAYSFANVFTSNRNENLEAVSVYACQDSAEVTAQIYLLNDNYTSPVDGQLVSTVTGSYDNIGFYTMKLDSPVSLEAGQKFSVVENVVYSVYSGNVTKQLPYYSLEYGLESPVLNTMRDDLGQEIGISVENVITHIGEGESYIYGISSDLTNPLNTWSDVSDPQTYQYLSKKTTFQEDGESVPNTYLPGNCMIKAYTTENEPGSILPTGVEFEPGDIYLSTEITGINSTKTSASLIPSNATGGIIYSVYPETVASVSQNGNIATVTAISEGYAKLIAKSSNGYVATKDIYVSNNQFIVGGVTVNTQNQDNLQIQINDCYPNPALDFNEPASYISVFVWSADDMSDTQALAATKQTGTNDWITEPFGINQTNSYLLNGNDIKYIIYIGDEANPNGNMVFSGFTSWVLPGIQGF